ncbi:MAG TPA: hypothetical protein V6D33_18380 [Cyanophyceae cyanobacterium]
MLTTASIAIQDPLQGLDIQDALAEEIIHMDDLPVKERMTKQERLANERLCREIASEPDSLYIVF